MRALRGTAVTGQHGHAPVAPAAARRRRFDAPRETTVRDRLARPDFACSRKAPPGAVCLDASRDRSLLKPAGAGLAGLLLGSVAGEDRDLLVPRFLTVVLTGRVCRGRTALSRGRAEFSLAASARRGCGEAPDEHRNLTKLAVHSALVTWSASKSSAIRSRWMAANLELLPVFRDLQRGAAQCGNS
jgi:hypothetical protein